MQFVDFARAHGLIVNHIEVDRWVSTPTEDKPRSSNGRYRYLGSVGWVQNWAVMDRPAIWFADGKNKDSPDVKKSIDKSATDRKERARKAAAKAGWIMHQTVLDTHPYLAKKGFPNECGNIWEKDGKKLLVIPMRIGRTLVGIQTISEEGEKKFLYGQTSKNAIFTFDALGMPIFCEGYATALSIREVMRATNIKYTIHVCFSASNMQHVAGAIRDGLIIADNDPNGVGVGVAEKTGHPYWISNTVGEDFNDYHKRVGTFKASQSLKKMLIKT